MSRRPPNPAAERAAQNTQTIKSLLKLEGNKTCADCKRNKHPRWASWNLGIFICIRCSGIHRGMGTHISRVKSVDLDAWTDEQLQSVLKWGNSRANKYWEAKLAAGHVPSEAKIENFIRTKYESKRWVMDGPMPDPSTLDAEGDDDIPLNLVKEKHSIERSTSQRASSAGASAPIKRAPPTQDLFDPVPRPATTSPAPPKAPPKNEVKQAKPADSLLGLDFFGTESAPPSRPAASSTPSGSAAQSRPDLKQSILSLYASAPKPAPVQQQHSHSGSIGGGMPSPTGMNQAQSSFGGFNDAFSSLSFGAPAAQAAAPAPPPKSSAFAGLGDFSSSSRPAAATTSSFGGSFFDTKPAQKSTPAPPVQTQPNYNAFGSVSSPPPASKSSSAMGDLFDLSAPTSTVSPPPPPKQTFASPPPQTSAFNLSSPKSNPAPVAPAATSSGWASNDAWGAATNAWGSPDPEPAKVPAAAPVQASAGDFGWGNSNTVAKPAPQVSADDDFGGWSSAPPVTSTSTNKPATGFGGSEDLFSNVWGD